MNSRGYCFDQKKTLMQQAKVCLQINITGNERSKNHKFLLKTHTRAPSEQKTDSNLGIHPYFTRREHNIPIPKFHIFSFCRGL